MHSAFNAETDAKRPGIACMQWVLSMGEGMQCRSFDRQVVLRADLTVQQPILVIWIGFSRHKASAPAQTTQPRLHLLSAVRPRWECPAYCQPIAAQQLFNEDINITSQAVWSLDRC